MWNKLIHFAIKELNILSFLNVHFLWEIISLNIVLLLDSVMVGEEGRAKMGGGGLAKDAWF